MKKLRKGMTMFLLGAVMCAAFVFACCTGCEVIVFDDEPLQTKIIADFTKGEEERSAVFASDGWSNGDPFNTYWRAEDVHFNDGYASVHISGKANNETDAEYYAGEIRTSSFYGYGDYTVRMKPSNVKGTVSSFFTCTGTYDKWYNEEGEVIKENDHDEIDIEFRGQDTTEVQFNYYSKDGIGHEHVHKLGFDASEEYHDYGFRWTEDHITWFVDGKPVYKVERANIAEGETWPEEPGRILMNYWTATKGTGAEDWTGVFEDDFDGHTDYQWISSTATPQPDPATTKPGSQPGGSEGDGITFTTDGGYDIKTNAAENSMTATYEDISGKGYTNITGTTDIGDNNTFTFNVRNNGAAEAKIRVDIVCPEENGSLQADGETRNNFCNLSMTATGITAKGDDYLYGGADWFTVAAGETASITVTFDDAAGATAVRFFIDSSTYDDETTHTGEVVFSDMEFSNVPAGGGEDNPDNPSGPEPDDFLIVDETITFTTEYGYDIKTNAAENSMTAAYEDISGKGYTNITGTTDIGDNNTFTFTVRNNGAAEAKIRVDIVCPDESGSLQADGETRNNFCNLSMTATGVIAQGNEYLYGGADWFTVAAGETASITVTFDDEAGATAVRFFIDSSTYDDETTHTGEVVFSDMALYNVA